MLRHRSNPEQPTDDILHIFKELINLKRMGKHHEAEEGYKALAEREKDEPINYPHVLKSWAKVKICLGEYEEAISMMKQASVLFKQIGNNTDAWQSKDQAETLINRHKNRDEFISYVQCASGGSVDYPLKYDE